MLFRSPNQNRLLAEGLATYGHQLLGGNPAYPNFGKDLDQMAATFVATASIESFERIATPQPLGKTDDEEIPGYVLGGSLVKFLIDKYGFEKFRAFYALTPLTPGKRGGTGSAERWKDAFGVSWADLVAEWKARLR